MEQVSLYRQLLVEMREMGDKNGCAPLAVAAAADIDYKTAYEKFRALGRKKRHGSHPGMILRVMKGLGFRLQKINPQFFIAKYPKSAPKGRCITPKQVAKYPEAFKGGTYIVRVRGHVYTIKNAEVIDWSEGRSHRSLEIFRVERA